MTLTWALTDELVDYDGLTDDRQFPAGDSSQVCDTRPEFSMKVVFCWSDISGYMGACWKELAKRDDIDLHVFAFKESIETAFDDDVMQGVSWTPLEKHERTNSAVIRQLVVNEKPDAVVLAGWLNQAYMKLPKAKELRETRFILGMDTPWKGNLRQRLARLVLHGYLKRISTIVVPGERAWQYAIRLGISPARIRRGLYGIDWDAFEEAVVQRQGASWPNTFLFAGRYNTVKGIDVLVAGYRQYRAQAKNPWKLNVCGMGRLKHLFAQVEGVTDYGFLQRREFLRLLSGSGALILPSRYDPWPLIVVEAAAAGLPLITSESCGSSVDVLRSQYNGLTVPTMPTPHDVAMAMVQLTARSDLPIWGQRSRQLSEPFSANFWATKWMAILNLDS